MGAEVIQLRSRRRNVTDPLKEAEARFSALSTYRMTLRSIASDGPRRVIRYWYSRPGWVRMEFVEPRAGMVLIYDPSAHVVRVWPFGIERAISMRFAAANPLLRDPNGHRVDRSDVGSLLENVAELRAKGDMTVHNDVELAGRAAALLEVVGTRGASVHRVNRYRVWLAIDTSFPLKVESFAASGNAIESVDMTDAELGIDLPGTLFNP